jgi:hypothetical protein
MQSLVCGPQKTRRGGEFDIGNIDRNNFEGGLRFESLIEDLF